MGIPVERLCLGTEKWFVIICKAGINNTYVAQLLFCRGSKDLVIMNSQCSIQQQQERDPEITLEAKEEADRWPGREAGRSVPGRGSVVTGRLPLALRVHSHAWLSVAGTPVATTSLERRAGSPPSPASQRHKIILPAVFSLSRTELPALETAGN